MNQQNEDQTMMNQEQAPAVESTPVMSSATTAGSDDVSEHKLWAIVGYILPFLFFIPIINEKTKNNAFARFHANQQLTLLVICIGLYVLSNVFFAMLSFGAFFIMPLVNLAILVLMIMGVIHAAQEEMKELPVVGGIKLLDKLFKA